MELESSASEETTGTRPIRLLLTEAGKANAMLRLEDEAAASQLVWEGLPPVYWVARVARPKPAAQVLLVDLIRPKNLASANAGHGLAAIWCGSSVFVGGQHVARRKNVGDAHHTALGVIAQRISATLTRRFQAHATRPPNYVTSDLSRSMRVCIRRARPCSESSVDAFYTLKNGHVEVPASRARATGFVSR